MEKGKITKIILNVLLIVLMCVVAVRITTNVEQYTSDLQIELENAAAILNQHYQKINSLESEIFNLKGDINLNQRNAKINNYGLADLWFSVNYDDNKTLAMKQFEDDNNQFFSECIHYANLNSVSLTRNYWDNNDPVKARYLVVSYDIGEIVYDKNGTINCYTQARDSPAVSCNSLCPVNEVIETAQEIQSDGIQTAFEDEEE